MNELTECERNSVLHVRMRTYGNARQADAAMATMMKSLRTAGWNVELLDVDQEEVDLDVSGH